MTRGYVSELHPLHAVVLARPKDAKPDTWITTGTPRYGTYPCACRLGTPCDTTGEYLCRCWGRLDPDLRVSHCCAARAARLATKAATTFQIGASA